MAVKKYKWYKIANEISEIEFNKNNITEVKMAGKTLCLIKTSKGLAACASKCPHAGGTMVSGFLDKYENIICPFHRYAFNLTSGRDMMGEGYYLKMYPVQLNDDGIFLGIEEGGFFKFLK
jgi:nitrite reductase/ring-hydroxylating ferredoxin subunit